MRPSPRSKPQPVTDRRDLWPRPMTCYPRRAGRRAIPTAPWTMPRCSVSLAARAGSPARLQLSQSWLACLLAATGQETRTRALLEQIRSGGPVLSSEATALIAVAEALLCLDDPEAARSLLEPATVGERPVRSSLWRRALLEAISPDDALSSPGADMPGFDRAVAAGAARRLALTGGGGQRPAIGLTSPPAGVWPHRPPPPSPSLASGPFGPTTRSSITQPGNGPGSANCACIWSWSASDSGADRCDPLAGWQRTSEGQNLRVTLSHLLDVLDPERERSQRSRLLQENSGAIGLDHVQVCGSMSGRSSATPSSS